MEATSALGELDVEAIVSNDRFTLDNDLDTMFVIWATTLVLFMQVQLCMQGSMRPSCLAI